MNRLHWPLIALALSGDGRLSPVQMQKALFLFGENAGKNLDEAFYSFVPYHYGPFDPAVYRDIDFLVSLGFVQRSNDRNGRDFEITPRGRLEAQTLMHDDTTTRNKPQVLDYLKTLTGWVKSLSFEDLIRSIYQAYPHFKTRSIFRD
jgi:Fe2+ or Zn2+ uptake regulation protein